MSFPIKVSRGPEYARILGIGGSRGNRVVDNAEICTIIDSTDEWIQKRTGISERRWVDDTQTTLSLAVEAARTAISRSGVATEQIDGVLVASISNSRRFPSLAVQVSNELGLQGPAAMDVQAACAGFCAAVSLADSMVRSGSAHYVLIIGVEVLSKQTDFTDRSTAFLFGDGAGAAVIGPSTTPAIGPVVWGSIPDTAETIYSDDFDLAIQDSFTPTVHMDGHTVFRWATTFMVEKTVETLEESGLTAEQLNAFIPHQANNRITDSMLRRLKLPDHVTVCRDIKYMGNSSASSVPLAMDSALESGQAKSGDTALIIAFGAGLVYAGQVVVLP